ncbi:hypothetical protein F6455_03230 [Proteobacteria bacterium 005FR1]|nr:hypothetical protein [Proteobacteria bacterium 005FR1]
MTSGDNRSARGKLRLLYRLEASLEAPMFVLALVWLWLFVVELTAGLTPLQQRIGTVIWITFIAEYLLKLAVAPRKIPYIQKNLLTLIALVIPAFRAFRLLRAVRLMRSARVVTSTRFVRALTSTRRLLRNLEEVQGERPSREINVGTLLFLSGHLDVETVRGFTSRLTAAAKTELDRASGARWQFHPPRELGLESESPQRPSAFLDEASREMANGPFDLIIVITEGVLVSRRQLVQPGLASPTARCVCLSLPALTKTGRNRPPRSLDDQTVNFNGTALLLHMLGHLLGLDHRERNASEVMAPFRWRELDAATPRFSQSEERALKLRSRQLPERELRGSGPLASLVFHFVMILRHPREVLVPLFRSKAFFLPFSLPGLATAAVAPTLILVFSAETWDVGLNMSSGIAALFAILIVLLASFYLVRIQSLFFPRKEKQTVTEHLAVANGVVFLSMLLACLGLFVMVVALMLAIQLYVFPENLMRTWPTLTDPEIGWGDQLRLAVFIATVGVATGALAGGLENRSVIQQLALFEDVP